MAVRDETAFHDFVAARSASLFRTALLMVGDHQLAQDLLQESLVKTYVAWPRLRDVHNAEAYARRVVVTTSQALVSADTNRLRDLYEKDLVSGIVGSPLG